MSWPWNNLFAKKHGSFIAPEFHLQLLLHLSSIYSVKNYLCYRDGSQMKKSANLISNQYFRGFRAILLQCIEGPHSNIIFLESIILESLKSQNFNLF